MKNICSNALGVVKVIGLAASVLLLSSCYRHGMGNCHHCSNCHKATEQCSGAASCGEHDCGCAKHKACNKSGEAKTCPRSK